MRDSGVLRLFGPQRGGADLREQGAVAVIVALVVANILFVSAAFAVDLGNALSRRVDLQGIADAAARAGARDLPDTAAAQVEAIRSLCAQPSSQTGWSYAGCSGSPQAAPSLAGSPATQITFTTTNGIATGIRVVPPPVRVPFNFGPVVGVDSIRMNARSSARIATALGLGVLPFTLLRSELTSTPPGTAGQFCVANGVPNPPALPSGSHPGAQGATIGGTLQPFTVSLRQPSTGSLPWDSGALIQLRSENSGPYRSFNLGNVKIVLGGVPLTGVTLAAGSTRRYQAPAPVYRPGTTQIWLEAVYLPTGEPLVSNPLTLTYTPNPVNPCNNPTAARGYLDIPRNPDPGGGDRLRDNITDGLDATIRPWKVWPAPHSDPGTNPCSALIPAGDVRVTSTGSPEPDINCVTTQTGNLPNEVSDGFFGPNGRMTHQCSGATTTAHAPFSTTIDNTRLFSSGSPLVATGLNPSDLKTSLQTGTPPPGSPPPYWLTSRILSCPRFGIVPVIDPGATVPTGRANYPIVDFRYVWIDDDTTNRGFIWSGNSLVGIRGYILDPSMLPPLVSESPQIAPYQPDTWPGGDPTLPKVVVLGPP
jgi:hypothetical protein